MTALVESTSLSAHTLQQVRWFCKSLLRSDGSLTFSSRRPFRAAFSLRFAHLSVCGPAVVVAAELRSSLKVRSKSNARED
jgi:hypothetical protein